MKRTFAALMVVLLVLTFLLSACTINPMPTGDTDTPTTPTTPTVPSTSPTTKNEDHDCTKDGHVYDASVKTEPTCTDRGVILYTCVYCDATREDKIAAYGHNFVMPGTRVEGTCKVAGHTDLKCATCGIEKSIVDDAPAAHHYVSGICTVCGKETVKSNVTADPYYDGETTMPDRFNTGAGSIMYADRTLKSGADLTGTVEVAPGVSIVVSGEGKSRTYNISVDYSKVTTGKEVVVADYDFSDGSVKFSVRNMGTYSFTESYGEDLGDGLWSDPTGGRFTVRLVNCSMRGVGLPRSAGGNWGDGGATCYYLDHCSIFTVGQCSNAVFNWCYIGGHVQEDADGMNPMQNVFVYNTYVADMAAVGYGSPKNELHVDATQIYGYDPNGGTNPPIEAKNLHHYNYRCEMPSVYYTGSFSYTNSCLMVSLDYTDAYDISFAHCFINGAGCPVMINDHPHMGQGKLYGKNNGNYNMYSILYKDIIHGCGSVYDEFNSNTGIKSQTTWNAGNYKTNPDYVSDTTHTEEEKKALYMSTVTLDNWNEAFTSLTVGSVWEKDGVAHFCVSNDTYRERQITIVTSNGTSYNYIIKRYPRHTDFAEDMAAVEFPVDIDVTIPETADWYVCYDSTDANFRQIRFVNKTENTVTLDLEQMAQDWVPAPQTYVFATEGTGFWKAAETEKDSAGNYIGELAYNKFKESNGFYIKNSNISYRLTTDGTLTISGTGAMPTLTQAQISQCDFYPMLSMIRKVVVEPGVTSVAAYFFMNMYNLEEVVLPSTLTAIGTRAFYGCNSLTSVTLPAGLTSIGESAFENCTSLKSVVIPEKTSGIGSRAFAGCISLREATILPSSMRKLPSQIFRGDSALQTVTFGGDILSVEPLAFEGCSALDTIRYTGTADAWSGIRFNLRTNQTLTGMSPSFVDAKTVIAAGQTAINTTVRKTPTYTSNKMICGGDISILTLIGKNFISSVGSGQRDLAAYVNVRESASDGRKGESAFRPDRSPAKAYDGEIFDLGFSTESDGEVTIKWVKGAQIVGFGAENAPKAPGCYVMVITVSGTANYAPIEIHQMFFIIDVEG